MRLAHIFPFVLGACSIGAQAIQKRDSHGYITTRGTDFYLNGSVFKFTGTNAYWLPTLTVEKDISDTFASMSAAGIKVVRTWAFNDVTEIPANGTWFQLIANGKTKINNGTNGLARLDKVIWLAQTHNIHLILSLTNNWNPLPGDHKAKMPDVARRDSITGNNLNRNYLSNDYGGMDAYVREFGAKKQHGEFYTDSKIINLFNSYITHVVSRYVDCPTILAWEIANDPRCISSLPTGHCNPQIVTKWHSQVARHIKSIDPNHIISSGSGGFLCTGCPKLFPPTTQRADERRQPLAVTEHQEWGHVRGPAFNGSQGVDSEDILGIPQIGFSSFQLFPDQDVYGSKPSLPSSNFSQTVDMGVDWIQKQVAAAAPYRKPTVSTGFGVVTENNAQKFIPFNSTHVAKGYRGVTDDQRDRAYLKWFESLSAKVDGMIQYQWGQSGLTPGQPGTPVSLTSFNTGENTLVASAGSSSPNDGYTTSGSGQKGMGNVWKKAAGGAS